MSSFYIVLACLFWAFDSVYRYPLISNGVSAQQVVSFEHIFALSFLLPIFGKSLKKILKREHAVEFIFVGCFGSAIATLAFSYSFQFMNPSVVIIFQKLQPLVAIIFARLVLGEPIRGKFFIFSLPCLLGAFLLSWGDFQVFLENYDSQSVKGYFYTLIAVLGWGLATVYGRKLALKGLNAVDIILGRFTFSLIVLIPLFLFEFETWVYTKEVFESILILVIISAILGMFFYYKGLKYTPARRATLLELFFPFFAVIVNWVYFGKELSPIQICGALMLVGGATALQLKKY